MLCWLSSTLPAKYRPQSWAVFLLCVHTELEKYALKMAPSRPLSQLLLVQVRSRAGRWSWAWELDFFHFSCIPTAELQTLSLWLFCTAVETAIACYSSCCMCWVDVLVAVHGSLGRPGWAPVSRFHSSFPLSHSSQFLIGLLASVDIKQQYSFASQF